MASPTLIQVLNAAGISNAENYCLASGVSLTGDIAEMNGVRGVPIADDREQASRFVPLSDISSIIRRDPTTFTTPSVFRSTSVAACASPASSPRHDYSLDACYMPTPENLDEILRQIASGDHGQATEGKAALDYARQQATTPEARREFDRQVEEAKQRIACEHPEELPRVEENYQKYQDGDYRVPQTSTLPESSAPKSGSSGGGTQGTGGGTGSAVAGLQDVAPAGTPIDGVVPTVPGSAGVAPTTNFANSVGVLLGTASVDDSVAPHGIDGHFEDDDVVYPTVVSAPVWTPVTLTISNATLPETIGRSTIPGNDQQFFQNLFGPVIAAGGTPSSPIIQVLTSSDPEARRYQEPTRRAVAEVLRNSQMSPGFGAGGFLIPSDQRVLSFRYDPVRRGIEVSLAPAAAGDRPIVLSGDEDNASGFGGLRRFSGLSLAFFRPGVDGIRRPADSITGDVTAFVPFLPPSQYMTGSRSFMEGRGGLLARSDAATDRAPTRISSRGNSPDEDRGSRGGNHGGNPDHHEEEELVAVAPESGDELSAHAA